MTFVDFLKSLNIAQIPDQEPKLREESPCKKELAIEKIKLQPAEEEIDISKREKALVVSNFQDIKFCFDEIQSLFKKYNATFINEDAFDSFDKDPYKKSFFIVKQNEAFDDSIRNKVLEWKSKASIFLCAY